MKRFIRYFARRHLLANLVTLLTILLGLISFVRIKRDIFPTVDFGEMLITTLYTGAAPEDVELNVTNKIEEELKEVTGILHMTSYSMENISVIDVTIDPDARKQDGIKRDIRDAVSRVTDFPEEVTDAPLITELNTSIFPVIEVGLSGNVSYRELRNYGKQFEKKLKSLSGVSSVEKFGYRDREIKVEVSPEAMHSLQIPLRGIVAAIRARNVRATGGTFESYTDEKKVVTLAQFVEPFEVGEVIVRSTFEGPVIRVKDLAIVKDDFEEERIISRLNGRSAISFFVNKKETADVIRTVDEIKDLVERENGNAPEGLEVLYSNDISYYVRNRLRVVASNGLIGLSLVVLLLTVFLNMRSAFWVAMGIPVTALGVMFMLPIFDSYLDVITLAALIQVIGIIVDDGIIIAENFQQHMERGKPPLEAVVDATHEVYWPVVTTIVTTFLAFAPMLFMSGIMGKFVVVIPLTISLALFISLFEVTVALPAHLTMRMKAVDNPRSKKSPRQWFLAVRKFYETTIRYVIKLRYLFLLLSIVALIVFLWYAANFMDFILFPTSMADNFYILVELPTGTSLQAASDKVKEIEAVVTKLPDNELSSFAARVGTQGEFSLGEKENWAIISVFLSPFAERSRTADGIVEALRQETDRLEGFSKIVYYIDAGGPPVGRPVTIRVVGSDDRERRTLADSLVVFLSTIDGIKDIDRNDKRGKDQVELDIDYDRLARLGLTAADVAQNVRIAFDGEVVTTVRYGDEDVDFRVQLQEKARKDLRYLLDLLVPNDRGRLVPLREVAKPRTGAGPSNFYHFDGERAVTVTADVVPGKTTPVKVTGAVLRHFDLRDRWPTTRFVIGGEAEETQKSMASLFSAFLMAVIAIYFVLILLFNSPTQPFIVMVAIPFGIMGVIITFLLHGQPVGFLALMGAVGLTGVVVNDSLVLVSHINRLRRDSPQLALREAVARGSADRLRAVLLTTMTTVAGVLPLAYGLGGSDPFIAPMALALGYGILFATPLTLGLVPCLYAIGEDVRRILGGWRR